MSNTPPPEPSEELDKHLETVMERACNNLASGMYADLDNKTVNWPLLFSEVREYILAHYLPKDAVREAKIRERKEIALDNYQGQTFSESTNWEGKFQKFIDNNEKRLKQLEQL